MTPEEAISVFDKMLKRYAWADDNKSVQAIKVAKECIEKQIAKKPNLHPCVWADVLRCSICNGYLGEEDEFDLDKGNYCPCCGQAMDWSEEE